MLDDLKRALRMDSPTPRLSESNLKKLSRGLRSSKKSRLSVHSSLETHSVQDGQLGERSVSLSTLLPSGGGPGGMRPRVDKLQTLEAKMASIEVSLGWRRRREALLETLPRAARDLVRELDGLHQALKDKDGLIQSLRTQITNLGGTVSGGGSEGGVGAVVSETERRTVQQRLGKVNAEMDAKKVAIKNLKLTLDKIDITDNIDVRIRAAELEYELEREELNVLNLREETAILTARLQESIAPAPGSGGTTGPRRTSTLHGLLSTSAGSTALTGAMLVSLGVTHTPGNPPFHVISKPPSGCVIDWATDDTRLKKGDRLVEVNGEGVVGLGLEEVTRLMSTSLQLSLVVARPLQGVNGVALGAGGGRRIEKQIEEKTKELKDLVGRLDKALKDSEGLRGDKTRLTHRISYLEDQVEELQCNLTKSKEASSNSDLSSGETVPPSQPGATIIQVFQKGPQTVAVAGPNIESTGDHLHQYPTLPRVKSPTYSQTSSHHSNSSSSHSHPSHSHSHSKSHHHHHHQYTAEPLYGITTQPNHHTHLEPVHGNGSNHQHHNHQQQQHHQQLQQQQQQLPQQPQQQQPQQQQQQQQQNNNNNTNNINTESLYNTSPLGISYNNPNLRHKHHVEPVYGSTHSNPPPESVIYGTTHHFHNGHHGIHSPSPSTSSVAAHSESNSSSNNINSNSSNINSNSNSNHWSRPNSVTERPTRRVLSPRPDSRTEEPRPTSRNKPVPPKKPERLSLQRTTSLQSVEELRPTSRSSSTSTRLPTLHTWPSLDKDVNGENNKELLKSRRSLGGEQHRDYATTRMVVSVSPVPEKTSDIRHSNSQNHGDSHCSRLMHVTPTKHSYKQDISTKSPPTQKRERRISTGIFSASTSHSPDASIHLDSSFGLERHQDVHAEPLYSFIQDSRKHSTPNSHSLQQKQQNGSTNFYHHFSPQQNGYSDKTNYTKLLTPGQTGNYNQPSTPGPTLRSASLSVVTPPKKDERWC